MNVKFKVIYEDGSEFDSHDRMYNPLYDHAHALAPHNTKRWKEYQIISDEQHLISVNFLTGCFVFKDINNPSGIEIQPSDEKDGEILTFSDEPQEFPVSDAWQINNSLPYFPVVGRSVFKGNLYTKGIDATVYFCGWKRKKGERTIEKRACLWPNGKFTLT